MGHAQSETSLGIKGGINVALLQGIDGTDVNGLAGFHVGTLVEIPLTAKFFIQPEALYSHQGFLTNSLLGDITEGLAIKVHLDDIIVPFLAIYYVIRLGNVDNASEGSFFNDRLTNSNFRLSVGFKF